MAKYCSKPLKGPGCGERMSRSRNHCIAVHLEGNTETDNSCEWSKALKGILWHLNLASLCEPCCEGAILRIGVSELCSTGTVDRDLSDCSSFYLDWFD
eukprot:4725678-Amphidinium_carterae.2